MEFPPYLAGQYTYIDSTELRNNVAEKELGTYAQFSVWICHEIYFDSILLD